MPLIRTTTTTAPIKYKNSILKPFLSKNTWHILLKYAEKFNSKSIVSPHKKAKKRPVMTRVLRSVVNNSRIAYDVVEIHAGDVDSVAVCAGVDDLLISDVDGYVIYISVLSTVKYEISGLKLRL